MSYLKTKSQENFEAGLELLATSKYNSSIHCFYYSCYQLIVDFFFEKLKWDQQRIDQNLKKTPRGSHNSIINNFISIIEKENSIGNLETREFRIKIFYLKKVRIKADYFQDKIPKQESEKVKDISEEILNTLKGIKL